MNPLRATALHTVLLLVASNVFMTFAWYGHLKYLHDKRWLIAALVSWGIALFEYLLQVPANRIGFAGGITLAQLKITQEVVTLAVFAPFAVVFMGQPLKLDYLWPGCAWSARSTSSSAAEAPRGGRRAIHCRATDHLPPCCSTSCCPATAISSSCSTSTAGTSSKARARSSR